ncbi:hypothetical protein [Brumicola pallidula]|jgi:hypothetical protein|uniref:PEP-CTERM protein-sorting domain-containing protein n=1 Tax=Brumicola pallidula DSM 14239 = ACAM 615 TaxID=1121922 RepID=K7A0Y4_9ALTE|nr:hypothetical protein [Glaciecola pallidula]GAC29185.1 hypothetical protein GPAL_2324 [Glaciecola pallidula DSM 14239 = ACAM 615]
MKFLKNISAIAVFLCVCSSASASVIFSDNFDRNNSNNVGNGWSEYEDDNNDVAIRSGVLRLRDTIWLSWVDAAASNNASTIGYDDIYLDFEWAASMNTEWTDTLHVSWNDGSGWDDIWSTNLGGSSFASVSLGAILGASNLANLQISFWTNVSRYNESAYIDNVVLRGTPTSVSNPSSIALLGLGLLGLGLASRKKSA